MKHKLKTFDEWSRLGYLIDKGSKHVSRNKKGICLFSSAQVTKKQPKKYYGYVDSDRRDDDSDFAYAGFFDHM